MVWTFTRRLEAAINAPLVSSVRRPDTRIIERPGWHQIVTPSAAGTHHNEVMISAIAAEDADRVIDEVVAGYRSTGHPTKWCVGPWTKPDDFGDRLARRGFTHWATRGMGISTASEVAPGAASVREMTTDAELDAYVAASLRGWSVPESELEPERDALRRAIRVPDCVVNVFMAFDDDECVGTGAVLLNGDHGYLLGTQVFATARGRGAYRSLVAARLAFLRARGIEYAVTYARESTSAPILEHLGFETLFRGTIYVLEAS